MDEEARIIEYLKAYVKREGTAPSVRKFCRDQNTTSPAFYRRHGSMVKLLEKAGLPIDERTKQRLQISKKATRKHVRKAERKRSRVQTPAPTVEGENCEPQQTPTFALIQEDLATEQEARESRKERTQQFADEVKALALNDDPEISGPIVDALCFGVLPTILEREFGVSFTLEELCQAELTLREVEEERKKVGELAKKNRDERLAIELEWEKVKRIPEKGELLEHIEQLQRKIKVLTGNLNEARATYNNYRTVFSGLWDAVFECRVCSARFTSYMESYPEVNVWFFKGDWRREKQKFLES